MNNCQRNEQEKKTPINEISIPEWTTTFLPNRYTPLQRPERGQGTIKVFFNHGKRFLSPGMHTSKD